MIIVTRTIEYQYDTIEDMAKDIACWTLRPSSKWFPFNGKKRARSTIVSVVDTDSAPKVCGHCGTSKGHFLDCRERTSEDPQPEAVTNHPSTAEAELAMWKAQSERYPGYVAVHKALNIVRDMAMGIDR